MDGSVAGHAAVIALRCERCSLNFESSATSMLCPCCRRPLVTKSRPVTAAPAGASRADASAFVRAFYRSAAARVPGDVDFSTVSLPRDARPLHVPMRRLRGQFSSRSGDHAVRYELDVCLADGLPDDLLQPLEHCRRIGILPEGVPQGECRLARADDRQMLERAMLRLRAALRPVDAQVNAFDRAEPQRGIDFYWPLWWSRVSVPGGTFEFAMDAVTGATLLGRWLPATKPKRFPYRLRDLLPLTLVPLVMVAAGLFDPLASPDFGRSFAVVAAAAVFGVGLMPALLRLWRNQLRTSARRGDLVEIEAGRRLLVVGRQIVWTVAILFSLVAVGGSLVRFARYVRHADPLPFIPRAERGWDFETLRPWFGVHPNFLQSPFGVNGRAMVIMAAAPLIAPNLGAPHPAPRTGRTVRVGKGGYASLAEAVAVAAPGDLVLIGAGVHPGGRTTIRHDLVIEGEPQAELVWRNERGPMVQIGGADTTVEFRHVRLRGEWINHAIIGDPNPAYVGDIQGVRPHLILREVDAETSGGGLVSMRAPGHTLTILGGAYRADLTSANASAVTVAADVSSQGNRRPIRFVPMPHIGVPFTNYSINFGDDERVEIADIDATAAGLALIFAGNCERVSLGHRRGDVSLWLRSDDHVLGQLPLPVGQPFAFKVRDSVAEF